MRLVGIGTVKNEADIIESFVRHNLQRLDALVLIDDGSVDGTKEILHSLEVEGLDLVVLDWDGSGYEQSLKLSEILLVLTSRFDFDWIFTLDADEAIDCESRSTLEKSLQKVSQKGVATLPWHTYVPSGEDDHAQLNPFLRIINRKERESPQYYKVAIPVNRLKITPVVIALGSQTARRSAVFHPLSMTVLEDVALAHFPVRTSEQLVSKAICGWLSMLAAGPGRPGGGFHWREMYEQFVDKGPPTPDEIERVARCYSGQRDDAKLIHSPLRACDPEPLRYRENSALPLFVILARTAEQIVTKSRGWHQGNTAFRRRTAWRHGTVLFGGKPFLEESAERLYLNRRFGINWQFADQKSTPATPKDLCSSGRMANNLVKAIVLVGQKKRYERFSLKNWLEEGWAVDHIATLAVRLLATSERCRRCSVVLVPCDKDGDSQILRDYVPAPGAPGWRESLCRMVLHFHFLVVKLYWFSRSTVSKTSASGVSRLMKNFSGVLRRGQV
jgi:glycosyl transferase family 2